MSNPKDEAVLLGWESRCALGKTWWWATDQGVSVAVETATGWTACGVYFDSEDAALTAAIDATPNARKLLAALAEIERLKSDMTGLDARIIDLASQRNYFAGGARFQLAEVERLTARLAAFEALAPKVEAVRVARKANDDACWDVSRDVPKDPRTGPEWARWTASLDTLCEAEADLLDAAVSLFPPKEPILPLLPAVAPKETT